MAVTYEAIATQTLGSDTNSVTFNSIPQTYTDLRMIIQVSKTDDYPGSNLIFNGTTGSYSETGLYGNGAGAYSSRDANRSAMLIAGNGVSQANSQEIFLLDIFNYTDSTNYQTVLSRTNGTNAAEAIVGLWRYTAAITSINIYVGAGNYKVGSTFTLYGIKAA